MEFERLKNTRDLGGLQMKDGRTIRPGMLIRSCHLSIAPARDLAVLRDVVGEIVDFRTLKEQQVHPDPVFEGVPHHPMPVLESMTAGITREEEADRSEIETYLLDPEGARRHMMENYQLFVTSEHARQCYSSFVKLLFAPREKALLWHCTAGKDRAGFATAIVLEILGADLETILEDYMKTNRGHDESDARVAGLHVSGAQRVSAGVVQSRRRALRRDGRLYRKSARDRCCPENTTAGEVFRGLKKHRQDTGASFDACLRKGTATCGARRERRLHMSSLCRTRVCRRQSGSTDGSSRR